MAWEDAVRPNHFFVSILNIYGLCVDAEMSEKTENRGVRALFKVI